MRRAIVAAVVLLGCAGSEPCLVGATRCVGSTVELCAPVEKSDPAWRLDVTCSDVQVCRDCAALGARYAGAALCTALNEGIMCAVQSQ